MDNTIAHADVDKIPFVFAIIEVLGGGMLVNNKHKIPAVYLKMTPEGGIGWFKIKDNAPAGLFVAHDWLINSTYKIYKKD